MAFKTSEKYKSVIYSGDCRHKLKLLFNGVELTDADVYCESLKVTSRIIPNGSTRFSLDNFVAKEAELVLHDIDTTIIQSPVNISIGTLVDGTYEYVPIGLFVVQDLPTTDKNKTTIKLRDYAVKFDFGYNAKDIIDENGGSVTKLQILQDICNKAGVETDITKFYGSNSKIGIYDNSITARTYISYLAEQAGAIATIDRSGKLIFVQLKDLETVEIPLNIVEKYEDGEKYEISRVVYEDAIRKFEYGDESKDTLFINTANPYIDNEVLTNTLTGTKIETSDSADAEVVNYKQYGITKQNVYSGKQLLDTDILSYSFEANTNGYVGGATATRVGFGKVILNANMKYYISYDVVETGTTNVRNTPMLVPVDGSAYSYQYIGTYNTTTGRKVWEFTPVETKEYIVNYWCNTSDKKVTIANMMVSTDSDISYEPYVGGKASPNPDYPQEIEVANKDLFNLSTSIDGFLSDNIGTINAPGEATKEKTSDFIEVKQNEVVVCNLKATIPSNGYIWWGYMYYDINKTPITERASIHNANNKLTLTVPANAKYFRVSTRFYDDGVLTIRKPFITTKSITKNIVKNSSFRENLEGWVAHSTAEIVEKLGQKCLHIPNILTDTRTVYQDIKDRLELGKTYTMTCNAYVENFTAGTTNLFLSLYFDGRKKDGSWGGTQVLKGTYSFLNHDYSNGFVKFSSTFKIPEDTDLTKPFRIFVYSRDNTADLYVYDLQIKPGDTNAEYQEFQESTITYNLGDNFLADKDYIKNGVLNKNIGKVVLDGSDDETWALYSNDSEGISFMLNLPNSLNIKIGYHTSICDKYTNIKQAWGNLYKNVYGIYSDHWNYKYKYFRPPNANITTVDQWKAWLSENNIEMYYELATPEQIQLETTGELRTFEPNTIITNSLDSEMEVEYARNQTQVSQILELNKNIPLNSFKTGKIIGNPAIDAYDIIKIVDGNKEFKTLATNDLTYNGVMINTFDTQIGKEAKKENVTLTPEATFKKWAKTEIDNVEAEVRINTGNIQTVKDEMGNMYTKGQVNELVANAETGVTNTFSEAGGNNEIRNSGLWFKNTGQDAETNPYEFWKGKANEGNNDKATNYRSILLGKGSFIQDDIVVPNGNYSISFYYRKLITSAIASVVINGKEYPLDSLETKQFYTGEQDSGTGEYIVDPIVVSNNNIKIEFKCDVLDGVEVYDLMCNKGTVKLAYSQNQNETTTSTVNISKGITITSSNDENVKFKADYDGIRILDGNNNPKTTFTDKGTETDELIVRKKATITGLLHQEVDDQTWVTKI